MNLHTENPKSFVEWDTENPLTDMDMDWLLDFPNISLVGVRIEPKIYSSGEKTIIIAVYSCIGLIGTVVNLLFTVGLVIHLQNIWDNQKNIGNPLKGRGSSKVGFFRLLAGNVSDFLLFLQLLSTFLIILTCLPYTPYQILTNLLEHNHFTCNVIPFSQGFSVYMFTGTTCAIACERCVALSRSLPPETSSASRAGFFKSSGDYLVENPRTRSISYLFVILFFSASLAFPDSIYMNLKSNGECDDTRSYLARLIYILIVMNLQLICPFFILRISHVKIRSLLAKIYQPDVESVRFSALSREGIPVRISGWRARALQRNEKISRNLCATWSTFVLMWMPLNLFNLALDSFPNVLGDFYREHPQAYCNMYLSFHLICMLSTISTPLIYGRQTETIFKNVNQLLQSICLAVRPCLSAHQAFRRRLITSDNTTEPTRATVPVVPSNIVEHGKIEPKNSSPIQTTRKLAVSYSVQKQDNECIVVIDIPPFHNSCSHLEVETKI